MNLATIAVRNIGRNKVRAGLTIAGVMVAILAFTLLRTIISAWEIGADAAAKDRVATRHKVSFVMSLPRRYIDKLRDVPGVRIATYASWFGAKNPRDPNDFFASFAVDPASYLAVYEEAVLDPQERATWLADRQGVILGDELANRLHVRTGDRLVLPGTIYPGDWDFHVSGIYTATAKSVDRSSLIMHWDYLNQSLPESRRDQIGWMVARIDDPRQSAAIAQRIDRMFDAEDMQTLSMSERALNVSFMGGFSAVLSAIDVVSLIILGILLLILGNTIAMGVRERTNEYGVMRALGFMPKHVVMFIVTESLTLGLLSGVVGLGVAYGLIDFLLGPALENNMAAFFPYFRVAPITMIEAVGFAGLLGALAAVWPAVSASRMTVTDSLRRID